MGAIDLKNAEVRFVDGDVRAGAVNNVAGYEADATTMLINGFTGAIEAGRKFTVVGSKVGSATLLYEHTVVSTVGGATPSSVTFTPGLKAAVLDAAVVTLLGRRLVAKIGEGNCSYSEKVNREYKKNRGVLDTVRNGDEEPVEVSIDATWEWLRADTGEPPTIEDVLKKRGEAAGWVSSSADDCEPYAVDIEIYHDPGCGSSGKVERTVLADFRYEQLAHDAKNATIAVTGKCNVKEAATERGTVS